MSGFLVPAAIVLLFAICILGVLVILMQRPSANAGMGAALGGGAAETVFGGESANVLTKITGVLTFLLFVLSFGLYLAFIAAEKRPESSLDQLAKPAAGETPAPVPVVPQPEAVKPSPQSTPAPAPGATAPAPAARANEKEVLDHLVNKGVVTADERAKADGESKSGNAAAPAPAPAPAEAAK